MLWGVLGDCPISWFLRNISCVVLSALSVHPPDFTSRVWFCLHVRHPVCMSECVKRVTRSEYFGNFLLLSRVASSALIVHSVVCMSVILYGRDSFCTVVRGRNLVVRRADDAALVRELPYRISVQYGTRTP